MQQIDVGRMINTLANIGVIAGIIFLGMELRQNNETMKLEQRISAKQSLDALRLEQRTNPALTTAIIKDASGQQLTPAEEFVLATYGSNTFDTIEWIWNLSPETRSDLIYTDPEQIDQLPPTFQRVWASRKEARNYDAGLVDFIENGPRAIRE